MAHRGLEVTSCPGGVVHPCTLGAVGLLLAALGLLWLAILLVRRAREARSGRWGRTVRGVAGALSLLVALSCLTGGGYLLWYSHRPRPAPARMQLFQHVSYQRDVRQHPRPLVTHLVTVELDRPDVRLLITPGRPGSRQLAAQSTSSFLHRHKLQLAINGQIFYPWRSGLFGYYPRPGQPVNVVGLNASRGVIYAQPTHKHPTLFLDRQHRASIGWSRGHRAVAHRAVYSAISGTRLLVSGGRIGDDLRRPQDRLCQPRTAVGIDRGARRLLLLVVDGRQPNYSEGVTLAELAQLLVGYGAQEAINLDGGGSSVLVAEGPSGEASLLSSPIDRRLPGRERPVANHLGIYAPRLEPRSH